LREHAALRRRAGFVTGGFGDLGLQTLAACADSAIYVRGLRAEQVAATLVRV
jgi:hypothetical protein